MRHVPAVCLVSVLNYQLLAKGWHLRWCNVKLTIGSSAFFGDMSCTYSPAVSRSFSVTLVHCLSSLPSKLEWCSKWWTPKTFAALFYSAAVAYLSSIWSSDRFFQLPLQVCQNICRFSIFTFFKFFGKMVIISHLKISLQNLYKSVLISVASRPNYPAPSAEVSLPWKDIGGINARHLEISWKIMFLTNWSHEKKNLSLSRLVGWSVFIRWTVEFWFSDPWCGRFPSILWLARILL